MDTHIYTGYTIPPYYDSLIGKLVAYGDDRSEAVARMSRALSELTIEGIKTTTSLHQRIMEDNRFLNGIVYTNFLDKLSN